MRFCDICGNRRYIDGCTGCSPSLRLPGEVVGNPYYDKKIKKHNALLAKRPPLEDLNKLWNVHQSFKGIAKELGVPISTIQVWMGDEHLMKNPGFLYNSERGLGYETPRTEKHPAAKSWLASGIIKEMKEGEEKVKKEMRV